MDRIVEVLRSIVDGMELDPVFAEEQKAYLYIPAREAARRTSEIVRTHKKGDSFLISVATIHLLHLEGVETFLIIVPEETDHQRSAVGYIRDGRIFAADPIKAINCSKDEQWAKIPLKDLVKKNQLAVVYDIYDEKCSKYIFMDETKGGFLGEPVEVFIRK